MKKTALFLMVFSMSASIQAADLQRNDVVGKWMCATHYDSIGVLTLDQYEFLADGNSKSEGNVLMPFDEKIGFNFHTQTSGKWSFDKNILTEIHTAKNVEKAHNEDTQATLKKEKAFAELEHRLHETLTEQPENEADRTIKLKWTRDKTNPKKILVEQIDGTDGKGFCYHIEK